MRIPAALAALLVLSACTDQYYGGLTSDLPVPGGVTYEVEPVGTGTAPSGILLRWASTSDPLVAEWHVYSRASAGDGFAYRGATTSPSFHDAGVPYLQYYVVSADDQGNESAASAVVTVDERLALERPTTLASTSLDGAIALDWSDNPYLDDPTAFSNYRVYSAHYDLDAGVCEDDWGLEGTTVAPEFIVGAMTNGVPRCFAVTAVSVEGYESLWSPVRDDTPRPDARNVLVYARQAQDAGSGFRFWQDLDADGLAEGNELGLLKSGSSATIDFSVERTMDGKLWLTPVRSGTTLAVYGALPVGDLTSIDYAPLNGYATSAAEAVPGWGYVFEMDGGDGFARYGAVRVTHVGQDYLILDWAYQTDPGNPELVA
ncbi:MAG TPA: hypothetical protein VFI13_09725, partial [Gemmatimonadales bacterium]|nr:hypothetical protein [Gemmatimonadales bacterium]